MDKYIKEMSSYCKHVNEESNRIHSLLVEFINANEGEIDTSNEDCSKDNISAYIFNDFADACTEYIVDKVRVNDGYVEVHAPEYYSEDENENWFAVLGGYVVINATLYNLCECLPEYVLNK